MRGLKNGGVDVAFNLEDSGELRAEFTSQSLYPDLRGKKFIGKAVENFLQENYFNFITGAEVKQW